MKNETKDRPDSPMSLTSIITKLHDGDVLEEASETFKDVANKVLARDGKGVVALELSISRVNSRQIKVDAKIKSRAPEKRRDGSTFFYDDERGITRSDPDQMKLREEVENA